MCGTRFHILNSFDVLFRFIQHSGDLHNVLLDLSVAVFKLNFLVVETARLQSFINATFTFLTYDVVLLKGPWYIVNDLGGR